LSTNYSLISCFSRGVISSLGQVGTYQLTGLGITEDSNYDSKTLLKIKRQLSNNYYLCLSPPTCQVKEQDDTLHIEAGKGAVRFEVPQKKNKQAARLERYHHAKENKKALQAS
jgi:hypothetical protein